jgi:hypothetical protein
MVSSFGNGGGADGTKCSSSAAGTSAGTWRGRTLCAGGGRRRRGAA